jgi:hypothetical protein
MRPCDVHLTNPRQGRLVDCPDCFADEPGSKPAFSELADERLDRGNGYELAEARRRRRSHFREYSWERALRLGVVSDEQARSVTPAAFRGALAEDLARDYERVKSTLEQAMKGTRKVDAKCPKCNGCVKAKVGDPRTQLDAVRLWTELGFGRAATQPAPPPVEATQLDELDYSELSDDELQLLLDYYSSPEEREDNRRWQVSVLELVKLKGLPFGEKALALVLSRFETPKALRAEADRIEAKIREQEQAGRQLLYAWTAHGEKLSPQQSPTIGEHVETLIGARGG